MSLINTTHGDVNVVDGLAFYVRAIGSRHGTPASFAAKCADHGLKWVALAGPWHHVRNGRLTTGLMNDPKKVRAFANALAKRGIAPFVWGYPWQGSEAIFARQMRECAGDFPYGLLDPELGSNPSRSRAAGPMRAANDHARVLVAHMAEVGFDVCGLSTFGSGVRMRWFPFKAFLDALIEHFRFRTFVGGQTYTDNARVDPSIHDFYKAVHEAGYSMRDLELVPNYGLYKWVPKDPAKPVSPKNRLAKSKTGPELLVHLDDFVDNAEPVDALIGWAENFMTAAQWTVLQRFAERMARGACRLPPRVA